MKLYLANCTRQRQTIFYRLDFNNDQSTQAKVQALKQVVVEPGKQAIVGGDLPLQSIQTIMDQLKPTGGVGVEELNRLPNTTVAYLLSVDKQITARQILQVHNHNTMVLTDVGNKRKRDAALVTNQMVEKAIESQTRNFELEIEQLPPGPDEEPAPGKPIEQGFRVTRREGESKPPRGSSRRR
jgi:hypothetical protein